MASPVAHSFAGFWSFLVFAEHMKVRLREQWRRYMAQLCLLVFVANLADLDFLPELLFHRDYHRGFSHSLLAAILASLTLTWLWKITDRFWSSFAIYFTAYGSHLLIDFFTGMYLGWNHSGAGIPLFWPWPTNDLSSRLILIYGVSHGSMSAIFSVANLRAICYDLVFFGSITTGIFLWRTRYLLKNIKMTRPRKIGGPQPEYHTASRG
jgi:inner membrane protein